MFRKLRALIILAGFCAACGGTPADGDVSANTSALYSFGPNDKIEGFSPYVQCNGQGLHLSLGSRMTVVPQSWGGIYSGDTYAVYFAKSSHTVLSLASTAIPLHTSMDGSYHTLTNDIGLSAAGMQEYDEASPVTPDGLWYAHPVEIPQNGITIYAAGERSDYPNGFATVTLDPASNPESPPVPEAGHGRCSYRQTFTISL